MKKKNMRNGYILKIRDNFKQSLTGIKLETGISLLMIFLNSLLPFIPK